MAGEEDNLCRRRRRAITMDPYLMYMYMYIYVLRNMDVGHRIVIIL